MNDNATKSGLLLGYMASEIDFDRLDALLFAEQDCPQSHDRNRPYLGQAHTDEGERGMTLVKGLTMRDVSDCIRRGIALATREYDGMDPVAVAQNACCEIEKMMGIFPNLTPEAGGDIPFYTLVDQKSPE
jgi:hypothetical protein